MLMESTICTIGWAIQLAQVKSVGVRCLALYLVASCAFLQLPVMVSWLSANTIGRPRKAMTNAPQIGFGNFQNLVWAVHHDLWNSGCLCDGECFGSEEQSG
ncbi:hypothetical protein BJ878DRAFT_527714 [Calycina marina]|uniref:Uncharacterized protein n=1 Tax=Calycina marina TaxID=1763456 RepID=A0A9P8CB45_9HELO|nr:hypothetical protein BJ878DRAFT_527714 [Calycina marina]